MGEGELIFYFLNNKATNESWRGEPKKCRFRIAGYHTIHFSLNKKRYR